MKTEKEIKTMIEDATSDMEQTKQRFGKEVYQKRFKPIFEGYLTALCTVLDYDESQRTAAIKGGGKNDGD